MIIPAARITGERLIVPREMGGRQMANRPIILTPWQVRAVQEGRLKQIRVPVVPQPNSSHPYVNGFLEICPFQSGDILYVREAWKREECTPDCAGREDDNECPFNRVGDSCYRYKTQYANPDVVSNWRSPATMPRAAARLHLPVEEVRVQSASVATEEDAKAEGIEWWGTFIDLWNARYAKKGYPWAGGLWTFVAELTIRQ